MTSFTGKKCKNLKFQYLLSCSQMQGPGDQNNLLSLQGTTDIRIICLKLVELIKFCNKTF